MDIYTIIKLLGIITFLFLVLTFAFGFFKLKIKNRIFFHKIFAIVTLFLGFIHGLIVIYLTYFR
ncbi:MAG: hypothetical protein N2258_02735 [Brevinematales bacterium]|nr:hypothetical protein [Brevinematales bacterium]